MRGAAGLVCLGLLLGGCIGKPPLIHDDAVLPQVGARYRAFYPAAADPAPERDAGLLRPRFGLPVIEQAGAEFPVEMLERGGPHEVRAALVRPDLPEVEAARCLRAQGAERVWGCHPLVLTEAGRSEVGPGTTLSRYRARPGPGSAPPPGGYDLYMASSVDAPTRAPRAVWLRADDPRRIAQLSLVHLSDLHVGKGRQEVLQRRLSAVISDVNAIAPDLVVITGDLVNRGQDPAQAMRARELLLMLEAPVLVVMGNHDIEFFASASYAGWPHFARAFHPFREFRVSLGGYDFIGFDSGPAERSPRILVRGLAPVTLGRLRDEVAEAAARGQRGVVLFSHAPSRASLGTRARPEGRGFFGRMRAGSAAFEGMLLQAAARGQRVLHLAGHTHWSDVFEARGGGLAGFTHWPVESLTQCPRPIEGKAAIITTQAASHSGVFLKQTARGYGFALVLLGDDAPQVAFHRYGVHQVGCPG